ncbi:MAG TPA: hypothetical protein VE621_04475, partial [Bryobacteraceae bacterium]|nr:hypothetical protein [Bryobacteraceae bacterium]
LNASMQQYNQRRNTEAVNRLAMLSMLLGAGAVFTGFFGMNFGREFAQVFFEPTNDPWLHYTAIAFVTVFGMGSLTLGAYLLAVNWQDYKEILTLRSHRRARGRRWYSLSKTDLPPMDEEEEV